MFYNESGRIYFIKSIVIIILRPAVTLQQSRCLNYYINPPIEAGRCCEHLPIKGVCMFCDKSLLLISPLIEYSIDMSTPWYVSIKSESDLSGILNGI